MEEQTKSTLKKIPETATSFEKDFNALKGNGTDLYAYLKNIPLEKIKELFKKSEVPTEVFSGILQTINNYGLNSAADKKWSGNFMQSLAKANNFEMTLMFAGSSDNKMIDEIVSKIRKDDAELANKVQAEYTAE